MRAGVGGPGRSPAQQVRDAEGRGIANCGGGSGGDDAGKIGTLSVLATFGCQCSTGSESDQEEPLEEQQPRQEEEKEEEEGEVFDESLACQNSKRGYWKINGAIRHRPSAAMTTRASVSRRSEHIASPPMRCRSSERCSRTVPEADPIPRGDDGSEEFGGHNHHRSAPRGRSPMGLRRANSDPFDSQQPDVPSIRLHHDEDFKSVVSDDLDEFEDAMMTGEEGSGDDGPGESTAAAASEHVRGPGEQFRDAEQQQQQPLQQKHATTRARAQSHHEVLPTLPRFPVQATHNKNCWSEPPVGIYQVRGPKYFADKKKVQSQGYLLTARGCDVFLSDNSEEPVPLETRSIFGGQLRMFPALSVNFCFPWGYMNLYFEIPAKLVPYVMKYDPTSPDDPNITDSNLTLQERSLAAWLQGSEEYKNGRLKLISYIPEGPWLVRNLVTGKPVIIGKKLPMTYEFSSGEPGRHAPLLTAKLDIGGSSSTAKHIVSVCRRYMGSLAVDIGFVVQAESVSELPEQMMGSVRIHNVDPLKAPRL